jgi:hypothetical protein
VSGKFERQRLARRATPTRFTSIVEHRRRNDMAIEVEWARMTPPELKRLTAQGNALAIQPVGSSKQRFPLTPEMQGFLYGREFRRTPLSTFLAEKCLMLNYLGQGWLLLADPHAVETPFYLLVPRWAHYPMVAFATISTVIASQAIISGAYSLTQQAMQLGFLPRVRVRHTASHEKGQIYIPVVNWLLAVGTLTAVLLFGSSDALSGPYGIAVAMLMAITTVLAAFVGLKWGYNPLLVVMANGFLLVIEMVFVAAF